VDTTRIATGGTTITNSTFSANSAATSGGALADARVGFPTSLDLEFDTLTGNTAPTGNAIATTGTTTAATTLMSGTILAGASGQCDLDAGTVFTDDGSNLTSDASCPFTEMTDLTGTDPMLLPLADNGGPTETEAIGAGSKALDGADTCPIRGMDQRGVERPATSGRSRSRRRCSTALLSSAAPRRWGAP
jgi:predicted outer membrane repeat protein